MSGGVTSAAAPLPDDLQDGAEFAASLAAIYGEAAAAGILATMARTTTLSFWINPLVDADEREGAEESDFDPPGEPLAGMAGVYVLPRDSGFTSSAAATSGRVYIQNPSSLLAVQVLDPQPGEEILDLAAAPGGKTIAMAGAMGNCGRIAAVEPVKDRFHRMRANLERCGVTIAELYQRDGRGVGRAVPARFDRVLLDAPCSSQARMRWDDPATYRYWSRRKVREASRKQKRLLMSAYDALKPGGVLLYCTCSFAPEENELVVAHLLGRSDARVLDLKGPLPVRSVPGLTGWRDKPLDTRLQRTCRIVPDAIWDGFYLALLNKP